MGQMVSNERLTEIIHTYGDMVYRLAMSYVANPYDADDVYQNVCCKLVEHAWKLESEDHIRYWLVRVTINFCRKSFRNKRRENKYNDDVIIEENTALSPELLEESAEDLLLKNELREAIRQSLRDLRPEEYRAVLYLYYYEQFSIEAIAHILHLTPGATKTKLSRARDKLRAKLAVLGITGR